MTNAVNDVGSDKQKKHGRWILVLLVLFFAVPLLLVMLMHHFQWHPQGNSYGELISPAIALQIPDGLMDANGKPVTATVWHDKWSMVYISNECADTCIERLHSMRQLHASFAKDIDRIQRVFISPTEASARLQKEYPDLVIINQPVLELPNLISQFGRNLEGVGASIAPDDRIYLVDPLGNLMMSYPVTIPVAEIRKDMQRLLRYSWAG
ncbi:MAG TPA: hypothetical protein VK974_12980 [Methylophilaceae bacterium]|nr:hypothetical protein [Methylophilaceae bacterium]